MQTVTVPSISPPISTPSLFNSPAPRETFSDSRYAVRFVQNAAELDAVLKLRFKVFNLELREGLEESFVTQRDQDEFDTSCHHLIVVDKKVRK